MIEIEDTFLSNVFLPCRQLVTPCNFTGFNRASVLSYCVSNVPLMPHSWESELAVRALTTIFGVYSSLTIEDLLIFVIEGILSRSSILTSTVIC